jgi:hypothetical protein
VTRSWLGLEAPGSWLLRSEMQGCCGLLLSFPYQKLSHTTRLLVAKHVSGRDRVTPSTCMATPKPDIPDHLAQPSLVAARGPVRSGASPRSQTITRPLWCAVTPMSHPSSDSTTAIWVTVRPWSDSSPSG